MAYGDFTLQKVINDLNLVLDESVDLFRAVQAIAPTDLLKLTLNETIPHSRSHQHGESTV